MQDWEFVESLLTDAESFLVFEPSSPALPVLYVSDGFEKLTGYSFSEVVGRNSLLLQCRDTNPVDILAIRQVRRAACSGRSPARGFEISLRLCLSTAGS